MSKFVVFFKEHSGKIFFFVMFLLSILYNVASTKYIKEVEEEIDYRDSLINSMTLSDVLVKRYFDISFDSIKDETYYTLKKEKLATITSLKRTVEDRPTEIVETTIIEEQGLDSVISSFEILLHDYNKLVRWATDKADSLEQLKAALEMIKKNYDISFEVVREKDMIRLHLLSDKADSAFMLLPYYRDRIQYDHEKKYWMVIKDRGVTNE